MVINIGLNVINVYIFLIYQYEKLPMKIIGVDIVVKDMFVVIKIAMIVILKV